MKHLCLSHLVNIPFIYDGQRKLQKGMRVSGEPWKKNNHGSIPGLVL